DEDERHAALNRWRGPDPRLDANSVIDMVIPWVASQPDALAVTSPARSYTYAELADRAAAVADTVRACGAGAGGLVAMCLERGADVPATILGVMGAGAAYVPLDASYPPARAADIIEQARPALVLADRTTESVVSGAGAPVVLIEDIPRTGPTFPLT